MPYEGAKDGRHYWLTPAALYASLNAEFGFDFDPCPYPLPEGFDGLTAEWGSSNYVNPPFKGPTAWVRKAIAESQKGKRVVLVFPMDKWIHLLLEAGAEVRNLRDVRWCATEDGLPGKGTGRHIAAFILRASPAGRAEQEPGEGCSIGQGSRKGATAMKFRKKPVVIDAVRVPTEQLDRKAWDEILNFIRPAKGWKGGNATMCITIPTLEGEMRADAGDWIIRGVKGEFYPCKPDIFEATYEAVP